MISTIHHIRLHKPGESETYRKFPKANYISISDTQRKSLPEVNWIKTIYNGIDVKAFDFRDKKENYFLFLGRISPEKGVAELCDIFKNSAHKLKIAARINEPDRVYYEEKVKPLIDGDRIEFVGEAGFEEKNRLLGGAKALVQWSNWDEPFGLVAVEAMACGTPVIVNNRGAMKEVLADGYTGFVVSTQEEFKARLNEADKLSPADCRKRAEDMFSVEKMASEYVSLITQFHR